MIGHLPVRRGRWWWSWTASPTLRTWGPLLGAPRRRPSTAGGPERRSRGVARRHPGVGGVPSTSPGQDPDLPRGLSAEGPGFTVAACHQAADATIHDRPPEPPCLGGGIGGVRLSRLSASPATAVSIPMSGGPHRSTPPLPGRGPLPMPAVCRYRTTATMPNEAGVAQSVAQAIVIARSSVRSDRQLDR